MVYPSVAYLDYIGSRSGCDFGVSPPVTIAECDPYHMPEEWFEGDYCIPKVGCKYNLVIRLEKENRDPWAYRCATEVLYYYTQNPLDAVAALRGARQWNTLCWLAECQGPGDTCPSESCDPSKACCTNSRGELGRSNDKTPDPNYVFDTDELFPDDTRPGWLFVSLSTHSPCEGDRNACIYGWTFTPRRDPTDRYYIPYPYPCTSSARDWCKSETSQIERHYNQQLGQLVSRYCPFLPDEIVGDEDI